MQSRLPRPIFPLLALGGALLITGCGTQRSTAADPAPRVTVAPPVPAAPAMAPASGSAAVASPALTPPAAPPATSAAAPPATQPTPAALAGPEATNDPVPVASLQTAAPTPPPRLSRPADEIVQLAQSKVGDEVLLAYIEGVNAPLNLGAPEILYLNDLGLSEPVVSAMVRRDQALRPAQAAAPATPEPPAPAAAAVPAPSGPPPAGAVETMAVSAPQGAAITHNYFYDSLSPYGSWMEVPDYGWCWRPTVAVVSPDWRPYCHNGRWLWSDSGWYWQSYYSWGWAPFHYGRWHLSSHHGWVWAPDTYWGPAWVTWRHFDDYYGWAPLPPGCRYGAGGFTYFGSSVGVSFGFGLGVDCYAFIPSAHFYGGRPWTHCVGRGDVHRFYGRTVVINNYGRGDGHHPINNGPGTRPFTGAGRAEIRRVAIRDVDTVRGRPVAGEHMSRDGATLAVYRPQLPGHAPQPPSAVTRRQQETRQHSENLTRSEAVRTAENVARTRPPRTVETSRPQTTTRPTSVNNPTPGTGRRPEVVGQSPRTAPQRSSSAPGAATDSRGRPTAQPGTPGNVNPRPVSPARDQETPRRSDGRTEDRGGSRNAAPTGSSYVPPVRPVPSPSTPPARVETANRAFVPEPNPGRGASGDFRPAPSAPVQSRPQMNPAAAYTAPRARETPSPSYGGRTEPRNAPVYAPSARSPQTPTPSAAPSPAPQRPSSAPSGGSDRSSDRSSGRGGSRGHER